MITVCDEVFPRMIQGGNCLASLRCGDAVARTGNTVEEKSSPIFGCQVGQQDYYTMLSSQLEKEVWGQQKLENKIDDGKNKHIHERTAAKERKKEKDQED